MSPGSSAVPEKDTPRTPDDFFKGGKYSEKAIKKYTKKRGYNDLPDITFRVPLPFPQAETRPTPKSFSVYPVIMERQKGDSHKHDLRVFILIPNEMLSEGPEAKGYIPIHVRFHGGGFCTGAPDYWPWFGFHVRNLSLNHNAITLIPEYRKMPESNGFEILEDIDFFWNWYHNVDLPKVVEQRVGRNIGLKQRLRGDQLLISGESAGGFLAAYSWLSQPKLRIKAMYLQYPMLAAYTRDDVYDYRKKKFTKSEVQGLAQKYYNHHQKLKKNPGLPPRVSSIPPEGMDMAWLFSTGKIKVDVNGKTEEISYWKHIFQAPDILDRMRELVAKSPMSNHPRPAYCPALFISHGTEDTNCPRQDSQEFVDMVKRLFSSIEIDCGIQGRDSKEASHAFDYFLDEGKAENKWLGELVNRIGKAWTIGKTP